MAKKFITINICLILLLFAAWPIPATIIEETGKLHNLIEINKPNAVERHCVAKVKKDKATARQKIVLQIKSRGSVDKTTTPPRLSSFIKARFYLSAYLERNHSA